MSEYSRELGTRKVKPESFFRYPPGDRSRDFPQRVYALIDSIEFDSYPPRPRAYYLDCVNANWFDEVWHGQPLANPESEYSAELE